MKTRHIYILLSAVALVFTACQNDDLPVQHPDGYDYLTFSVSTEKITSRAEDNYGNYDSTKYPSTMGVWCSELSMANTKVEYIQNKWNSTLYWENYASTLDFNFFGYMPYNASASLTTVKSNNSKVSDGQKISFPVTIADGITCTQTDCPLISKRPTHLVGIEQNVKLYMDQVLTAFSLQFSLGSKMDDVRDVVINSVKFKDAPGATVSVFPVSGTVSRTYSYPTNDKYNWTSGDITWTDVKKHAVSETAYSVDIAGTEDQDSGLKLSTSSQQWGNTIFCIPTTGFSPVIEVSYDVTLNGTDGIETRKSVTSSIVLSKTNFPTYDPTVAGTPGIIYPIQIKIVPSYLYVLADADQTTGYIAIQ